MQDWVYERPGHARHPSKGDLMGVLKITEKLCCDNCIFMTCYERGTCYDCECYLDSILNVERHCDQKTHPTNCPLLDGRPVTIKATAETLTIEKVFK